jgi:CheY-like chemotaxis protein
MPAVVWRELLALSQRAGMPAIDLDQVVIPLGLVALVSEEVLRRLRALPLADDEGTLTVVVDEPGREAAADELAFRTGRSVSLVIAPAILHAAVLEACLVGRKKGDAQHRGRRARAPFNLAQAIVDAAQVDPAAERTATPIVSDLGATHQGLPGEPGFLDESSFDRSRPRSDVHQRERPRVLVVDDEPAIREIVRQTLEQRGIDVVEAADGQEALRAVKERAPDALLLDAELPGLHGLEVLTRLRASQHHRELPVVMITGVFRGWRLAQDLEETLGVSRVLEKPFDVRELAEAVELALARRRMGARGETVSADAQPFYDAASVAFREGRLAAAAAELAKAVAIDPLSALLHHQLGLLEAQSGHDLAAISALEAAIAIEPRRYPSLRNLAIIYQRRGLRRRARGLWERAMDAAPDEASRKECRDFVLELL